MSHSIKVVPYDSHWPEMFQQEADLIKSCLQQECLAVHHVGSTAIHGLIAKPKIDIIAVFKDNLAVISQLAAIGYSYRGEYNIPFHSGFSKRKEGLNINLHAYEEGNPEIALNLAFRDYLRTHPDDLKAYAALKSELVKNPDAGQRGHTFSKYNHGKDVFIKAILNKAGFKRACLRFCTHPEEWEAARNFLMKYGGAKEFIHDAHTFHFVFYKGVEIVGYSRYEWHENHPEECFYHLNSSCDDSYYREQITTWFAARCLKVQSLKSEFGKGNEIQTSDV